MENDKTYQHYCRGAFCIICISNLSCFSSLSCIFSQFLPDICCNDPCHQVTYSLEMLSLAWGHCLKKANLELGDEHDSVEYYHALQHLLWYAAQIEIGYMRPVIICVLAHDSCIFYTDVNKMENNPSVPYSPWSLFEQRHTIWSALSTIPMNLLWMSIVFGSAISMYFFSALLQRLSGHTDLQLFYVDPTLTSLLSYHCKHNKYFNSCGSISNLSVMYQ